MGVAARDRDMSKWFSGAKTVSRYWLAGERDPSEASQDCSESSVEGRVVASSMLGPMERKSTSMASWVRPRCALDPRIVCVCTC